MPSYPITHLVVGARYAVLCAGPWLQVLDASSGELLAEEDTGLPIRVLAVDDGGEHVVTAADNKKLVVRQREGLRLLSTRELPKRATSITFADSATLIVADKFGDVFRYPLHPPAPAEASTSEKPTQEGELLLGHVSIITALQLSPDGKHIITGDRDEHIRVSRYPASYVIERFLFGHRRYVTALHIPPFAPETLISGGGEPQLFLWDWADARLRGKVDYERLARGFVLIKPVRKPGVKKGQGRKRKKGSEAAGTPSAVEQGGEEPAEGEADGEGEDGWGQKGGLVEVTSPEEEEDITFSVQKIAALEAGEERAILWSLVGCSALLYLPFPPAELEIGTEGAMQPQALNLGKPILDFWVQGAQVWITLDASWPGYSQESSKEGVDVRLARWERGAPVLQLENSLLAGLNRSQHEATADQLRQLESYADLLLLPKYGEEPEEGEQPGPKDRPGAKSEGRKKTREALARLALDQDLDQGEGGGLGSKRRKTEEAE
ncbi:hypothetical protein CALVIDRAFT_9711 [Calocera viscosa TUFC12733]|uniref:Uncharacterized protein n=1 Tax=Calocera viscosa (strain TUFC12733) TaxID=1330018 RepID=A0A167S364_CALVF|nr:hypothetical protein CALVIDRAFT_9711 [Calocera viscosa TUFC12733]